MRTRTRLAVHRAVAAERARLARDMHDTVCKTLYGIRLIADTMRADQDPGLTWTRAMAVAEGIDLACTQVREVLDDLRRDDSLVPLPDAVRQLALAWSRARGIPAAVHVDPALPRASGTAHRQLLAVLDEALTNVARHSGARRVTVSLGYRSPCLELVVADDGCGVDTTEPPTGSRYGLVGMAERARSIGASLAVARNQPSGTRVVLQLPVPAS